ncbi:phenylalanine--tRNA ligase subunit beta [Dokdonella sp.]|uniref:phenylalanine--tRNA ligase subunit beta n=1 Tax=Dokdonella sp. TaxID=2291710 RepID=UPI0031C8E6CB|nr:phenylalanine--tRNA ligase subunit beta [Dokdonella sp.]
MKISENWLRSRVPLAVSRDELIERLDMIGHEVEGAEVVGKHLDGIVVGQITACARHPEADRLQVCSVDVGTETLQIVCGAPNARVGLKAPLARIGARVGELTIKAAKLRGIESFGMLCSARELGLDADASGLLELPGEAPVGAALAEVLGLPDCTLDLGLTPNRADCLSLEGLAADVAAAFQLPWAPLAVDPLPAQPGRQIEIRLAAPADCPRYCGRFITGIDATAATPAWMRQRLAHSGLRPISLLVDVTNYVMLELGQPLHAFDAGKLSGPIGVRRGRPGEHLRLLDQREVALDDELLVITDADRPVALAGLMGGWDTRIDGAVDAVFLEAAHFAPAALAGRARRLGMATDAAHRFERGVDADLPRRALERATRLILDAAGGSAGEIQEAVAAEHLPARTAVPLRRARIARVLGIEVPDGEVARILRALDMQVVDTPEGWLATPPGRRFDIAIEEDLIEEVARIHGYQHIPDRAPSGQLSAPVVDERLVGLPALCEQLAARGYFEALTYAFCARELLATWGLAGRAIALANPLSAELAVMRTSLLPGLVAALAANRSRQQARVRLFEQGRIFAAPAEAAGAPTELDRIAGAVSGAAHAEQWGEPARALDFFDLKGDIQSLLALTGDAASFDFVAARRPWLHPGQSAELRRGETLVGIMGALHPALIAALGLEDDVHVFELDLAPLRARAVPRPVALSRYPSVRRDLSFELPAEVEYAHVESTVRAAVGELLVDVVLFDRYAGGKLDKAVKSLAIGLILQDSSRTLADADADRCVALAVAALESACNARLRGAG